MPGKGTLFRYVKQAAVYLCPSESPGPADDTPLGGGGNGRLSYSMNAYIGYKAPEQLQSFTYVADSLDNPLPGGQKKVSFNAGQRVVFSTSTFMTLFEDHPSYHTNSSYPDGSFNCIDRIATRHTLTTKGNASEGRSSIAFLDGHVEARLYPAKTLGRELFAEFGQPPFWRERRLPGPRQPVRLRQEAAGPLPVVGCRPRTEARLRQTLTILLEVTYVRSAFTCRSRAGSTVPADAAAHRPEHRRPGEILRSRSIRRPSTTHNQGRSRCTTATGPHAWHDKMARFRSKGPVRK